MTEKLWQTKLTAWLHDPAEKCFVLFHDPSGHDGGTIKTLLTDLKNEIGLNHEELEKEIKKADWYAASADRPQWPMDVSEGRYERWSQVDFSNEPILIHPLTGDEIRLNDLSSINYKEIKTASLEHFREILKLGNDARMKFLALWRFGCENREELGQLWSLLPADTRVPDHSIWNHLDLTSAFAGASIEKNKPAILSLAFGPVQSFIAQARSTSDLWAGSHLLSSIVWEGMKVIAEEIGPDAFLFPQIRGLAIVDAWLLEQARKAGCENEWHEQFKKITADWLKNRTDSNPLFAACLPNKFSAIVPKARVRELAEKVTAAVRSRVRDWAGIMLEEMNLDKNEVCREQLEKQLNEFPNVFWSAVEWPEEIKEKSEALKNLKETCALFTETQENFFETDYWKLLSKEIAIGGKKFWEPRTGVVYPAIYELSEKSLASAKTIRNFDQLLQHGFRCTLCGEREWLCEDREELKWAPGHRKNQTTVWSHKAGKSGIKKGEHLCAVCALKRFWPVIFTDMVRDFIDKDNVNRYVISTHTMSLVPTLNKLAKLSSLDETEKLCEIRNEVDHADPVVLPKKLFKEAAAGNNLDLLKRIPNFLDSLEDSDNVEAFHSKLKNVVGKEYRPETYYALILMDGDNMGAWLSATETERRIKYSASWHPKIKNNKDFLREDGNENLNKYFEALKTASPTRHAAISQALNSFSSLIVPHIIENEHNGKLIYSGGDDVLAMVPTDDVLSVIQALRMAYSGFGKEVEKGEKLDKCRPYSQKGFVLQNGRLLQTMGSKATASVGVVIVHHQTPLAYALKCLREAEQSAKNAGRNAFCIRILKRSGGEISFTDNWWNEADSLKDILLHGFNKETSAGLFEELIKTAATVDKMSRKAFYAIEEWRHLLPEYSEKWSTDEWELSQNMAAKMLKRQFSQHGGLKELAEEVVKTIWGKARKEKNKKLGNPIKQLSDMLFCAEFFARETRSGKYKEENNKQEVAE
ncbi:MAG: CRISPR-associated protein Cmr2 [Clostridiales bacterium]|nr:CRISPR-associated protein Cmr2 [Clostridiales bacterium]MDN5282460.1 CRISPR-associated protein Cmr2 [Candidatus Ozemobacter sp.]